MAVVIDDHLLLELLAGLKGSSELGDEIYTTGCWYYRLTRAVMAGSGSGSLSGRFASLGEDEQRRAVLAPLKASSAVGLIAGLSVPFLVAVTAACLVVYFLLAVAAHFRAHDLGRNVVNAMLLAGFSGYVFVTSI